MGHDPDVMATRLWTIRLQPLAVVFNNEKLLVLIFLDIHGEELGNVLAATLGQSLKLLLKLTFSFSHAAFQTIMFCSSDQFPVWKFYPKIQNCLSLGLSSIHKN
jgi:hypothetical protein